LCYIKMNQMSMPVDANVAITYLNPVCLMVNSIASARNAEKQKLFNKKALFVNFVALHTLENIGTWVFSVVYTEICLSLCSKSARVHTPFSLLHNEREQSFRTELTLKEGRAYLRPVPHCFTVLK
jgi:hypothetical protein